MKTTHSSMTILEQAAESARRLRRGDTAEFANAARIEARLERLASIGHYGAAEALPLYRGVRRMADELSLYRAALERGINGETNVELDDTTREKLRQMLAVLDELGGGAR